MKSPDPASGRTDFDCGSVQQFDLLIIGAGFAGLYMLYRARQAGLSALLVEAGDGVGGTWFWNRYPGARCDGNSRDYSYSFSEELQQEWTWSERYAGQPEILAYLEHVADRFDLHGCIRLGERVVSAHWHEDRAEWQVRTERGLSVVARFVVAATGCLSAPLHVRFPGQDRFRGDIFYTSTWPRDQVDLAGRRVGVVGTGSSGVQVTPWVAREALHTTVFQRTANFTVPARNAPTDPVEEADFRTRYAAYRAAARRSGGGVPIPYLDQTAVETPEPERTAEFERAWQYGGIYILRRYRDVLTSPEANAALSDFVRGKIRAGVTDPARADLLTPTDVPIGVKRLCVDTDYYETFNRSDVDLVDAKTNPIVAMDEGGVILANDQRVALDAVVMATGFDAITGALNRIDVAGRAGRRLVDAWAEGPTAYLGVAVAGFPNLFLITGPGSPSVLGNMVVAIEQHVEWVADLLSVAMARRTRVVEAETDAQEAWMRACNEAARETLFPTYATWYMGANVPGKTRVFMPYAGGYGRFREICDEVARDSYRGMRFHR